MFACCAASIAQISVDKSTKDLGALQLYTQSTTQFTLKNTTNQDIAITRTVASTSVLSIACSSQTIPAGGSVTVTLTNDIDLGGRFTRTAYIYTNASDKPVKLSIRGKALVDINAASRHGHGLADQNAFGVEFGNLLLNTDNIEFDRVNDGDVVEQTLFVTNNSDEKCEPNLLLLPPYLSVRAVPAVLPPGRKGKLIVTLDTYKLNHRLGLTQNNVFVSSKPGEKVSKEMAIPVSVVLFDTTTVLRTDDAPVISLSTTELTMPASNKPKVKNFIEITNNGKSMLSLKSVQTMHPAINVSLPKTQIAPGETIKMSVTVIKKYLDISNASHRILLISNDYTSPIVYILVNNSPEQ